MLLQVLRMTCACMPAHSSHDDIWFADPDHEESALPKQSCPSLQDDS